MTSTTLDLAQEKCIFNKFLLSGLRNYGKAMSAHIALQVGDCCHQKIEVYTSLTS